MKSLFVRLSVLALATTGFAASTLTSNALAKNTVSPVVIAAGSSLPSCNYHTPCGID